MAATPTSSKAAARSRAVIAVSLAQPSTATRPPRASMPTTMRPGYARQAALTRPGSLSAAVPRMTRATPRASRRHDRLDGIAIHWLSREGAVEIDDMQPDAAGGDEALRLAGGIVAEDGRRAHFAAQQAHALAAFEVDRGKEDHGAASPAGVRRLK